MIQHTPGPWRVKPDANIVEAQFRGEWYALANIGILNINNLDVLLPYREQTPANARLIAAAPDLLAALKEAVEALSHVALHGVPYDPDNEQRKRVHQRGLNAIAKTEEES